jgi:hypothetical protein
MNGNDCDALFLAGVIVPPSALIAGTVVMALSRGTVKGARTATHPATA